MIITLTLNPAVDQTSWVERLVSGLKLGAAAGAATAASEGTTEEISMLLPQVEIEAFE